MPRRTLLFPSAGGIVALALAFVLVTQPALPLGGDSTAFLAGARDPPPSPEPAPPEAVAGRDYSFNATTSVGVAAGVCATPGACYVAVSEERLPRLIPKPDEGVAEETRGRTWRFEISWTPSTPASASLRVLVRAVDGTLLREAAGASPLSFDVPDEELGTGVEYVVSLNPSVAGAMVRQEADVRLWTA